MNASAPRQADRGQIARFVEALFRHADPGSFVSLRTFYDDANQVFEITPHCVSDDRTPLIVAAASLATRAARVARPVVFAPPVATFNNSDTAAEKDLANGLVLSVECDQQPAEARRKLEALLGRATVVVASGGEWPDPETGEIQDKLHLHWRLTEPTRDTASHQLLKTCRGMAMRLVGGDPTSMPLVHPMRWPGSWHRKKAPRLARIEASSESEIELDDARERLEEAWKAAGADKDYPPGAEAAEDDRKGESRDTAELIKAILTGADFHAPITALAMRFLKGGMPDGQAVLTLRGFFMAVPESLRDTKDGVHQPGRWQARYDDIPRAVATARAKLDEADEDASQAGRIEHFRLDRMTAGDPPPQRFLLEPLMPIGKAGLLFGVGGIGKSLVALDLCLAVATRARDGASPTKRHEVLGGRIPADAAGASLFLTLEDDKDELHRRVASLDPDGRRHGAPCYVIPAVDLPDFDPTLVKGEGRTAVLTRFASDGLDRLLTKVAEAAKCPVRLLVLDPAGDFLNADENDATFVKLLMRHLRAVAARHGCTILLLGHVAKAIDADAPSMRGSSAWIANSRFAVALWPPMPDEAERVGKKLDVPANTLVWGSLVKANHAGAPIGHKRLFTREGATGRMIDITARLGTDARTEDELLKLLVTACAECAAAGLPFSYSGVGGLYFGRADLPEPLGGLSRGRLQHLGNKALDEGALVKARTALTQGAPKYLDIPDGPLATGKGVEMFHGSRREALERFRAARPS